jgi:hypothetical protein
MGALIGAGIGVLVFILALQIFMIICMWKIYAKAGEPGWACIVPIYNIIVLLKIVNKPAWWFILLIIPIVGLIIAIIVLHRLSLSFGQGAGYTIGLLLVPIIFLPMLAFGSATYKRLEN